MHLAALFRAASLVAVPVLCAAASFAQTPVPDVLGIRLGMTMAEAETAARRSCDRTEEDLRIPGGRVCPVVRPRPEAEGREHVHLLWAAGRQGRVFSMMLQYWQKSPAAEHVGECDKLRDLMRSRGRAWGWQPHQGNNRLGTEAGRKYVKFDEYLGPPNERFDFRSNPGAPYFYVSCTNMAHADIWDDKVLIQLTLREGRRE